MADYTEEEEFEFQLEWERQNSSKKSVAKTNPSVGEKVVGGRVTGVTGPDSAKIADNMSRNLLAAKNALLPNSKTALPDSVDSYFGKKPGEAPSKRPISGLEKTVYGAASNAMDIAGAVGRGIGAAVGQGTGNTFAERMSDPEAGLTKAARKSKTVQELPGPVKFVAEATLSAFDNPFTYWKGAANAAGKVVGALGGGRAASSFGEGILMKKINPNATDMAAGYKTRNVVKNGLDKLSPEAATDKLNKEIFPALESRMKNALGASKTKIDLADVIIKTEADLIAASPKDAAMLKQISNQFREAMDQIVELESRGFVSKGIATMDVANDVKRSFGKKGAWYYGIGDPESTARERVANALHKRLKEAIDASDVGDEIKAINKEFSELIPIERALITRIPAHHRQSMGNDMAAVGLILGGRVLTASAAVKGLSSQKAGSMFYRLGDKIEAASLAGIARGSAPAARLGVGLTVQRNALGEEEDKP